MGTRLVGFDEQFDRLWRTGYQVAYKILGDREEASDVAQDALIKTALQWATTAPQGA